MLAIVIHQPGQAMAQDISVLGELSGGLDQIFPFDLARAVLLMGEVKPGKRSGNAGRPISYCRAALAADKLAVLVYIKIAVSGGRCHLSVIDGVRRAILFADDHKPAAAEIPRFGIDHGKRDADSDRRVNGISAAFHYRHADLGSELMLRSHHRAPPPHRLPRRGKRPRQTTGDQRYEYKNSCKRPNEDSVHITVDNK